MKPPPLPPLPGKKPPPITGQPRRQRAVAMELQIGKPPVLSLDTQARLVALNNSLVRDLQTEFKLDDNVPWGSPTITVVRIMVAQALERSAKYGKLEVYEELRRRAVKNITAPPAIEKANPRFSDDAPTEPMMRRRPNLGDE